MNKKLLIMSISIVLSMSFSVNTVTALSPSEMQRAESYLKKRVSQVEYKKMSSFSQVQNAMILLFWFLLTWWAILIILRGKTQQYYLKTFISAISYLCTFWLIHNFFWRAVHQWSSKTDMMYSLYNWTFVIACWFLLIGFCTIIQTIVTYLLVPRDSKLRIFAYLFGVNLIVYLVIVFLAVFVSN